MATLYDTLSTAIADLVHDGETVALEGFTHLIPSAAGHEIVRQGRRHLTLVRLTPDVIYDQLIGMGVADRLVFSWGGNPGVGSLHRFRDAVERGWPHPLEIEEHSHAGLTNAYLAGASGLPFGIIRGYLGGDLVRRGRMVPLRSPFGDEELIAVPAVRPDVTVIHAQQADGHGNVMFWGMTGIHKEAVLAARRSLVTVEEIVDEFPQRTGGVVLPGWVIDGVAVVPGGAHPSYATEYDARDNEFYRGWDAISRDRDAFLAWMHTHVLSTRDHAEYLASIGGPRRELSGATPQ